MAEFSTRFTSKIDEFADAVGARRNQDHLRRLTGSPEVLRRRTKQKPCDYERDSGQNIA
jgi:hypothetical protein